MTFRVHPPRAAAVLIQLLAMVGIIGALVAAPPARGRIMLVPFTTNAARGMVATAVDRGASLVGRGSLPGSIVVEGDRAILVRALFRRGVALLAAPAAGCGQ
jgi:hypothetical protein